MSSLDNLTPEIRNAARKVAKLAFVREYIGIVSDETGYPATVDYQRQNDALFRLISTTYGECECPAGDCPSWSQHSMVQDLIERMEDLGRAADDNNTDITIDGVDNDLAMCERYVTSY